MPTVRDMVVQATLKRLLEPIFEPLFSTHSYGFRPGRSQRQAVEAAHEIVTGGKAYGVDIDLANFLTESVMIVSKYIEKRVKLIVNRKKRRVARSERMKFLSMTIVDGAIAISHQSLQAAVRKVKELPSRGTNQTLE